MINLKKHPVKFYLAYDGYDHYMFFSYHNQYYDWHIGNAPCSVVLERTTKQDLIEHYVEPNTDTEEEVGWSRITSIDKFYSLTVWQFSLAKYLLHNPDILNDPLLEVLNDIEIPDIRK